MSKKKLIIFIPSIEGGGVEKNLFIIANYLSSKIKDISIISTSYRYKNKFSKTISFKKPYFNFLDNFSRTIKYFICLIILLKKIIINRNIVVFSFQANLYAITLCKIFNIPIIIRPNSSSTGWLKNKIKKSIFKFLYSFANMVIVNSYEFKKEFKKKLNISSICIYNPLNKKEIINLSKKKNKNIFYKKSIKQLNIINIGRMVDQKDQLTLLKALNLIKNKINFKLLIIGSGKKEDELKRFIDLNNLNKKIKLLNYMENPYTYLKKSDILVHTSKYEGLPNVLLEALVLKKFVISSNCPTGPKEILNNGKGGMLFQTGNFKQLSKMIVFCNSNAKFLRKKVKYAYKNLNRFDSTFNLNKYYKIIEKELIK